MKTFHELQVRVSPSVWSTPFLFTSGDEIVTFFNNVQKKNHTFVYGSSNPRIFIQNFFISKFKTIMILHLQFVYSSCNPQIFIRFFLKTMGFLTILILELFCTSDCESSSKQLQTAPSSRTKLVFS